MSPLPSLPGRLRTHLSSRLASSLGLAGVVGIAAILAVGANRLSSTSVLVLYGAAFVPYVAASIGARDSPLSGWWYLVAAALVRALFIPASPRLSDDIYRYVWDGRVGLAGINPFRHAPAAEALASLRDPAIWPNINHPEIPTIYPPGAQYLFQLNAALGGGVAGLKVLLVGIELLAVGICWYWLTEHLDRERLTAAFVVYALNPLIFVEVAWSGHLDVAAWSLLVAGLVVWQFDDSARSAAAAAAALGASVAVKFLGLVALPFLAVGRASRDAFDRPIWQRIATPLAAAALLVASYLPMADAGAKLFAGFGTYAKSWRGNDGAYRLAHGLGARAITSWAADEHRSDGRVLVRFERLDPLYRRLGWTETWKGETIPATTYSADELAALAAKGAAGVVLGLVFLLCLLARSRPLRATSLLILVLYLFAPVVHPWYVAWLVPIAALRGRSTELIFSFTVLAAYLAWHSSATGGPWHVPGWAVALEYGAVLAAWWWEAAARPLRSSNLTRRASSLE